MLHRSDLEYLDKFEMYYIMTFIPFSLFIFVIKQAGTNLIKIEDCVSIGKDVTITTQVSLVEFGKILPYFAKDRY